MNSINKILEYSTYAHPIRKGFLNLLLIIPKCIHKLATQPEYLKLPPNYVSRLQPQTAQGKQRILIKQH